MRRVRAGEQVPTGQRWLWSATAEDVERPDPLSVTREPLLWFVFDEVRARYSRSPCGLRLTARQQQVAYLHFLEGLGEGEIAAVAGCRVETVRTHLREIRRCASEVLRA